MVLGREKRSNAGKNPHRNYEAVTAKTPSSTQSKAGKQAISKTPSSKSYWRPGKQATAHCRLEENSPTPPNDEDIRLIGESSILASTEAAEEEEEEEQIVEIRDYNIEWSVFLGKKPIFHTQIKPTISDFEYQEEDTYRRANKAADRLQKVAERRLFEASVKLDTQKPWLWTIEDSSDLSFIDTQVQTLQIPSKCSQSQLRVAISAHFDAVDRPDEDTESTVESKDNIAVSTAQKTHKRALSELKAASSTKKQRETATQRQRATETAIDANCLNFGHPCYILPPPYGHIPLNSGHLRDWNQAIKDDPVIGIQHPPPSLIARMTLEKQVESKKRPTTASESASTVSSTIAGLSVAGSGGINLNFNLSSGGMAEWLQQLIPQQVDSEAKKRDSTSVLPPSSPIPQAIDEDSRLSAFIYSRIRNRPAQRREFERALGILTGAGVGFSDLACLTMEEWKEMGIGVGIRMDLLKNDKIWHLQHPESVEEVDLQATRPISTVESNDSEQ